MKHFQGWKKVAKDYRSLHFRVRLDRKTFILYSVLRGLVILTLIDNMLRANYEAAALCVLSLILFLMPAFFEKKLKIEIPPLFEGIIYCFIFAAEILGEVNKFYTLIPGWDTLLHTLNGFLCAAIGFAMVDLLNRHSERMNLSPFYLAVVSFCFSMTIGVLWEFFEFFCDQLFNLDMQKDFIVKTIGSVTLDPTHSQTPYVIRNISRTVIETADGRKTVVEGGYLDIGLIDTMKDLFVNFIGAVVFSALGYVYVKTRDPNSIVGKLMVHRMTQPEVEEVDEFVDRQEQEREQLRRTPFRRKKTVLREQEAGLQVQEARMREQKAAFQESETGLREQKALLQESETGPENRKTENAAQSGRSPG